MPEIFSLFVAGLMFVRVAFPDPLFVLGGVCVFRFSPFPVVFLSLSPFLVCVCGFLFRVDPFFVYGAVRSEALF